MEAARNREGVWLVRGKTGRAARMRLFCFPYAGGGAASYRDWGALLPHDVEVVPLQLPGRETRLLETPFTDMGELTKALVDAVTPVLDTPFCFFGHSMGAVVSFEVARELRRLGMRGPSSLFVSAGHAPHIPDPDPPVHELPDGAMVAELHARYDGIPSEVLSNKELLELILPGLRGDMTLIETYSFVEEEPLDVPIVCFGGAGDHRISREQLEGWARLTRGEFVFRQLPGDHFFLHSQRSLLLRYLAGDLNALMK
jgi:medium-chain acyl-[acyl-carrier-protein] hydrolase